MKAVIIGSGWLGLPLAESLAKKGIEVVLSYRSSEPETRLKSFVYPGKEATQFIQSADLIVLAFPPSRVTNEQYSLDCLEIVRQSNANTHFILTSSTSVYPDQTGIVSEESVLSEQTAGNLRIWLAERALENQLGNRLTVVRLGGLIGPERYPVTAMSRTGKQYIGDEPLNVLHLDDAIGLIEFLAERKPGGIINACSPHHPTKEEYYTWMAKQLNCPVPDLSGRRNGGKTISSEKSIALGYVYKRPDPFQFI